MSWKNFARFASITAIGVVAQMISQTATAEPLRVLEATLSNPESVAAHGTRRFVSTMGASLAPTTKDGDGSIAEFTREGHFVSSSAFPDVRLDAPKGLLIVNETLFIADIDRVVGINLQSGTVTFSALYRSERPVLLNDIAEAGDGTLLVTETLGGQLLRLDPSTGNYNVVASGLPGANGIVVDRTAGRVFVACIGANFEGGRVMELPVDGGEPQVVQPETKGLLDGIALAENGIIWVSDWVSGSEPRPGLMWSISSGKSVAVELGADLQGPADFYFDPETRAFWIPMMLSGKIVVVDPHVTRR